LPGITVSGAVMLLIAVSGIVTTVELLGFVALNIVKLNAPSAFVAFFVILIVAALAVTIKGEDKRTAIRIKTRIVE